MATVKGAINTAVGPVYGQAVAAGVGGPANWVTGGFIDGRVKVMLDYYLAAGTEVAATVIQMGSLLPVGAKILAIMVQTATSTGSLTWSVGDLDSATRYVSASTNAATAGTYWYGGGKDAVVGPYVIGSNPATPTATDNDQQIIITTGGATLGVQMIVCAVFYTTD